MKVAVVGASGETGRSIVNGLLEDPAKFEITALVREASRAKPAITELQDCGIKIVSADLDGPEKELEKALSGMDVLISAVDVSALMTQVPLANAARSAGVKRFIPCSYGTIAAPKGVMDLRDTKEDVINHIKKIKLPYTIIDVGWWYQLSLPRLPSGRIDYAVLMPRDTIAGDGTVPSARTDLRDVGRYVARIIADPRTMNKMIFAYNEVLSQNQIYDLLERRSGEKIERFNMTENDIQGAVELSRQSSDPQVVNRKYFLQYLLSWGIRGDNTPDHARYLGYLDAKDLYPELKWTRFEDYISDVLSGVAKPVYMEKKS